MKKTILAFGDSLTFGTDRWSGGRHAYENRWPSVLEHALNGAARVVEEGLGGRTTVFDDHALASDRNGARVLPTLLDTHKPLDLVIIMLGANDVKLHVGGTAYGAAMGMKRLAEIVCSHAYGPGYPVPKVILVPPPLLADNGLVAPHPLFVPRADEMHLLAPYYRQIAEEMSCGFFDAASVAVSTADDGVHLDVPNTRVIGDALAPLVRETLGL